MPNVDKFIAAQPHNAQLRLRCLRKLILDAAPHVEEHIKYGLPFYTWHGLLYGDNKEIRKVKVTHLTGPLAESLRQLVQEALLVNEGRKKKRGVRSGQ